MFVFLIVYLTIGVIISALVSPHIDYDEMRRKGANNFIFFISFLVFILIWPSIFIMEKK